MEYVPGGDMRGLLNNVFSLNIEEAKVYLAEMILAVLDLHKLNYVHRDLKPGNALG
jgi:cell cycle protein kinase DBF2